MFVLVVHTILAANCVRPNTTIGNYFCVGGPATLYNEDDKMSLGETNCPGVGDDVPKALLDDGTPFPSEVRGERCACDWGSQKPDPLILQRTQLITCTASVGPLHTNMSYIQKQLKRGHNITLMGQCPQQRDKCVGFYTNAWIDGNDVKLPGVCQAVSLRPIRNSWQPTVCKIAGGNRLLTRVRVLNSQGIRLQTRRRCINFRPPILG